MGVLSWALSVAVGLGGAAAASAGPLSVASDRELGTAPSSFEQVVLVCGPYRYSRRPGWLYLRRPGLGGAGLGRSRVRNKDQTTLRRTSLRPAGLRIPIPKTKQSLVTTLRKRNTSAVVADATRGARLPKSLNYIFCCCIAGGVICCWSRCMEPRLLWLFM